jgi:hypothetical protein
MWGFHASEPLDDRLSLTSPLAAPDPASDGSSGRAAAAAAGLVPAAAAAAAAAMAVNLRWEIRLGVVFDKWHISQKIIERNTMQVRPFSCRRCGHE